MTRLLVASLVTTAPASHDGRPLVRVAVGFVVGGADDGGGVVGLGLTVTDGVAGGVEGAGAGDVTDGPVGDGSAVVLPLPVQAVATTAMTASTIRRTRRPDTAGVVTSSRCTVGTTSTRGDSHETRRPLPAPVVQTGAT